MTLTVASFNIRKAIGTDRKRRPDRILDVLAEIDPHVVTLQEADKRVGTRAAAIPHDLIAEHGHFDPVDFHVSHPKLLDRLPDHPMTRGFMERLDTRNLGWHGNAILVKRGTKVLDRAALDLPTLEPRGAVMAELEFEGGRQLRVIGMHLDLTGMWRKRQARRILAHVEARHALMPTILMGDTNEWRDGGCLDHFGDRFSAVACGPTFHSRRPVANLDRILVDRGIEVLDAGVHASDAAKKASDHLPVWARLNF